MKIDKYTQIFLLFGVSSIFIKIPLTQYFTHYGDLLTFKAWGLHLAQNGFQNFYSSVWSDYLPGYLYILTFLGYIQNFFLSYGFSIKDEILYKFPSLLTDFGNGLFIYLITCMFTKQKYALLTGIFALFNPAFLANSTFWGQAESFMMFFLLSSFYFLLKQNYLASALLIGFGQTVKPIAIFLIPIFILHLSLTKVKLNKILIFFLLILTTIIVVFTPFTNQLNIFEFILERHQVTANQYPYASLNAFNFWAITTNMWKSDELTYLGLTFHSLGIIILSILYITLLAIIYHKRKVEYKSTFLCCILAITYLAVFLFLTRIHERHMFYGLSFTTLLLPVVSWTNRIAILGVHLLYIINLYYAFSQINNRPQPFEYNWVIFLSIINISIFLYLLTTLMYKYVKIK